MRRLPLLLFPLVLTLLAWGLLVGLQRGGWALALPGAIRTASSWGSIARTNSNSKRPETTEAASRTKDGFVTPSTHG